MGLALSNASKAGVAIFVGTVQYALFAVMSEVIYSAYGQGGYSQSANYISDLGANCTAGGQCYIPPSALLYNSTIVLLGLLLLLGAYYLHKAYHFRPLTGLVVLTGIGAAGVGIFPETAGVLHSLASLMAFLFGGLAAVVAARFVKRPMSYFSVILGLVTLAALILYLGGYFLGLGAGGMERVVVYPEVLWGVGYGGYLMATGDWPGA